VVVERRVRRGFAFVAQVTEDGPILAGPDGQQGQDLGVGTQGGGVVGVFTPGPYLGCPQRPAVVGC
jgi:hypothetical protein